MIEITDGKTVFGKVEVGSGEVWENESSHDVDVNLDKSFPYADRKSVKIMVTQKSSSKNWGWEGYLTVNGVMGDNSDKKLIDKTREFKPAENNNPKEKSFTFE